MSLSTERQPVPMFFGCELSWVYRKLIRPLPVFISQIPDLQQSLPAYITLFVYGVANPL